MTDPSKKSVLEICRAFGGDRARLLDILRAVQARHGCVSPAAIDAVAAAFSVPRVEVQGVVTFYAFLSEAPKGRTVIRLCNDVIDCMQGADRVARAFEEALGIRFGQTTPDGAVTLEWTPCIGMSDQAPAALVNDVVVTTLNGEKAAEVARAVRAGVEPARLVGTRGDGHNAHPLVRAMVRNNLRSRGPVVFAPFEPGVAMRKALAMTPAEVIRDMKTSRLRGRGGAGFPTGMKWDFARQAPGRPKYVLCNADEGEPGTFKDRVVLTECPDLVIEGMTIAGYALGAECGILYLRAEYAYLREFLERVLADRRAAGLLGRDAGGKPGFRFDIEIRLGAGAYVCGEETAMISSCEGGRGDPKNRPPFPAQKGYQGCPTVVNNVETFCCVARILDQGPGWFAQLGSKGSPGTKLLSVSGDCRSPGVYEVPFGIRLRDFLAQCGADDAAAVQVGGPSGRTVGPADFERTICYDDLATGGSVMVFGPDRDIVEVARRFLEFFVEESCGYCTPCRVGCVLMRNKLDDILAGRAEAADLDALEALGRTVKVTSRCGLGQTAANPVFSTLQSFRPAYERKLRKRRKGDVFLASFDIHAALETSRQLTGRNSLIFDRAQ